MFGPFGPFVCGGTRGRLCWRGGLIVCVLCGQRVENAQSVLEGCLDLGRGVDELPDARCSVAPTNFEVELRCGAYFTQDGVKEVRAGKGRGITCACFMGTRCLHSFQSPPPATPSSPSYPSSRMRTFSMSPPASPASIARVRLTDTPQVVNDPLPLPRLDVTYPSPDANLPPAADVVQDFKAAAIRLLECFSQDISQSARKCENWTRIAHLVEESESHKAAVLADAINSAVGAEHADKLGALFRSSLILLRHHFFFFWSPHVRSCGVFPPPRARVGTHLYPVITLPRATPWEMVDIPRVTLHRRSQLQDRYRRRRVTLQTTEGTLLASTIRRHQRRATTPRAWKYRPTRHRKRRRG
ncbi:hypothetical protein EDB89DRAFT_1526343 [Lactarius sanguifluus]|nr:hypothetical protein EDB89DRAFT_1526343 [Lactarius sanguifluus]